MALRFIDGFDHYATADATALYTTVNTPNITTGGRFGNRAGMGSNAYLRLVLDAQATWIVGFAFKVSAPSTGQAIVAFRDGAVNHVELRLDASGHLYFTRNSAAIGSVGAKVIANAWRYIEVKVTIADSPDGVAICYVDEELELNGTGLDTRNAGNASADTIVLGPAAAGSGDYDDYYICDATGSAPTNTFLGDVRVESLFPNGNGNSSQLVGSDGNSTDNYLLVDETTPATADYVESSTAGNKDTYTYTNLTPSSGTVFGVQLMPYAAKTDAGTRSIVSVARLSGTEVDSSAKALSTTPLYYADVRETKPGGGSWTISDVNGAEFGVKVNA